MNPGYFAICGSQLLTIDLPLFINHIKNVTYRFSLYDVINKCTTIVSNRPLKILKAF